MLKLTNVKKYFNKGKKNQVIAIDNLTLDFNDKGLVCLLGPSGCGKTTLLNAIGGLDSINSGSILINDKKINKQRNYKKDKIRNLEIGYIFQDYKLIDNLSVYDNVALPLRMIGLKDKKEINMRVEYILDKLGILRYKKRPCGMLSGGERQRVGIARALVKNPNIILADEPTGNLDSKNSVLIMNIIKSISKDCLVIMVTHEESLAKFYADRILEISDGSIVKDYENKHDNALEYEIDNRFYLKDFEVQDNLNNNKHDINIYSHKDNKIKLDIVIVNDNVYIKSANGKLEVVDNNSSIEFIDDHKKELKLEEAKEYEFNFKEVITDNFKKKYTSIYNVFSLIRNGFKRVFAFPVVKKLLLAGFFVSGLFIMYSFSSIKATLTVSDKDFVTINPNYLIISANRFKVDDYLKYEEMEAINYMIPGNNINFSVAYSDYYQTANNASETLSGSLTSIDVISSSDLLYGKMPENEYEIVVDKLAITKMFNSGLAKMAGIINVEDILNRTVSVDHMPKFTIVGICDLDNPSIYANKNIFINLLANQVAGNNMYGYGVIASIDKDVSENNLVDYSLYRDKIVLKEGKEPLNDYEVIVNFNYKESMPINKEISYEVNGKKLKVVGYYTSVDNYSYYFVNNNTIKYNLITSATTLSIFTNNKDNVLAELKALNLNIKDSYSYEKNIYLEEIKETVMSNLIVSGIMLLISLIEIFLMIRASLLSRVREIGILRAIGVKKSDIYKMFSGEILAITTIASLPGLLFMIYCLKTLSSYRFFSDYFTMSLDVALLAIIFTYLFNFVVGLLPIMNIIRKTPAAIMARNDFN